MAKIAGIGSRELSAHELATCEKLGGWIVLCGHQLHSGNAPGADQAFARYANTMFPERVHLHRPWMKHENQAIHPKNVVWNLDELPLEQQVSFTKTAEKYHPAWRALTRGARRLMARNTSIITPPPDYQPVDLVLAFPQRAKLGGTGQGMRVAQGLGVRVVDLRDLGKPELARLCEEISRME